MPKRQRSDSAAGQVNAMRSAMTKMKPPSWVDVPKDALPFWYSITGTRPHDKWTEPDLENAAELARTKWQIEVLTKELAQEGPVIRNDRGTPIANPKIRIKQDMVRLVISMSRMLHRMLHVHAEATGGESTVERKANKAHAKAKQQASSADDDLIAKPH